MTMTYSQYLRIESDAGGIGCTHRAFVRACHSKLADTAKTREKRDWRHMWIRDGLRQLQAARRMLRDVNL